MIRWPILAIFWNGYPPSPTTGFMNCCRTTGSPQNNKKHLKRTRPAKRAGSRGVHRMLTVISVHLKRRQDLTAEQSGRTNYDDPNALYYLFRLGPPLQLTQSIINIPDSFMASIKLTTLSHLSSVQNFAEIKGVYHELLADEPSTPTGTS